MFAHHSFQQQKGMEEWCTGRVHRFGFHGSPPSGAVGSSTALLGTSSIQSLTNLFALGSISVTANFISFTNSVERKDLISTPVS